MEVNLKSFLLSGIILMFASTGNIHFQHKERNFCYETLYFESNSSSIQGLEHLLKKLSATKFTVQETKARFIKFSADVLLDTGYQKTTILKNTEFKNKFKSVSDSGDTVSNSYSLSSVRNKELFIGASSTSKFDGSVLKTYDSQSTIRYANSNSHWTQNGFNVINLTYGFHLEALDANYASSIYGLNTSISDTPLKDFGINLTNILSPNTLILTAVPQLITPTRSTDIINDQFINVPTHNSLDSFSDPEDNSRLDYDVSARVNMSISTSSIYASGNILLDASTIPRNIENNSDLDSPNSHFETSRIISVTSSHMIKVSGSITLLPSISSSNKEASTTATSTPAISDVSEYSNTARTNYAGSPSHEVTGNTHSVDGSDVLISTSCNEDSLQYLIESMACNLFLDPSSSEVQHWNSGSIPHKCISDSSKYSDTYSTSYAEHASDDFVSESNQPTRSNDFVTESNQLQKSSDEYISSTSSEGSYQSFTPSMIIQRNTLYEFYDFLDRDYLEDVNE